MQHSPTPLIPRFRYNHQPGVREQLVIHLHTCFVDLCLGNYATAAMVLQACLFVIMAVLIVTPEAAKILMVPGNLNSHTLSFAALGEELSQAGHQVQILMPSNNKMANVITQNDNFTITRYHVDGDTPFVNSRSRMFGNDDQNRPGRHSAVEEDWNCGPRWRRGTLPYMKRNASR